MRRMCGFKQGPQRGGLEIFGKFGICGNFGLGHGNYSVVRRLFIRNLVRNRFLIIALKCVAGTAGPVAIGKANSRGENR